MPGSFFSGQNNETNSLFTYDIANRSFYFDKSFTPIFFNANLSIMFPDSEDRREAQNICYQNNETDPNPTQRRQCYFDYKATGDSSLAQATSASEAEIQETRSILGIHFNYVNQPCCFRCVFKKNTLLLIVSITQMHLNSEHIRCFLFRIMVKCALNLMQLVTYVVI